MIPPLSFNTADLAQNGFWVFGYGSLMWRPGFTYCEQSPARLEGWHRALCLYSVRHRGTPEAPGLVLGLDEGGECTGIAFKVAPEHAVATYAYLHERELQMPVYLEETHPLTLADGQRVEALVYTMNRAHPNYAAGLSRADIMRFVRQGVGESGRCLDYVRDTLTMLQQLGLEDTELGWLAEALPPVPPEPKSGA